MAIGNKNYAKITGAFAALLMVTGSLHSSEAQNGRLRLLEQTGITSQIYSLTELIDESSQTHATRCQSRPASKIITGFNAESVIHDLLSAFNLNYTQSLEPIERWYKSPLAKKIQSTEKETIDNSLLTDFLKSEKYKHPHRQNLISKIVDNIQAPRFIAILGTEVEYAGIVHSGCIESGKTTEKFNREQITADITRKDKDLIAMLVRGEIIAETAYLYRNFNNEELERYEAFTSSKTGSQFYASLIDALQTSFKLAGDRLTKSAVSDLHGSLDF